MVWYFNCLMIGFMAGLISGVALVFYLQHKDRQGKAKNKTEDKS